MDEDEIRRIVKEELKDILSKAGLSGNDIIIKDHEIKKKDIDTWGISSFRIIRKVKNYVILAGEAAGKIINVVIVTLGVWQAIQFGSVLLFEKNLPEANHLAYQVHNVVLNLMSSKPIHQNDEPERFIVSSERWQNYTDSQYKEEVYTYLSNPSSNDILSPGTYLVASTATPDSLVIDSSSYPGDFKIS